MKDIKFYINSIKKLNNGKVFKKILAGTTALVMLSMSSCSNKPEKNDDVSNSSIISTDVVEDNTYVTDYSKTGVYTEKDFNNFKENAYKDIKNIRINISEEDFTVALLMLNQEYLTNTKNSNTQLILDNYFKNSEGINVYDDANQLFQLLAEVRNYNTEYYADNNNYSFINFLIPELLPEEEYDVILKLEEYASIVRSYYNGQDDESIKEEVKRIFKEVKEFGLGTGKIQGRTQVSLSNGTIFVTENIMQQISSMCQNIIPYEERNELDIRLNSSNGLFNLENSWSDMAYHIGRVEEIKYDEKAEKIYDNVTSLRKELFIEAKKFNVTEEQFNSLFAIANIDYFMKDTRNFYVFEKMYGEDFNVTDAYQNALQAVVQTEFYNYSTDNKNVERFDMSKIFIDSKEDTLSVKGLMSVIDNLDSKDKASVDYAAKFLLDYSKYSNLATINAKDETTGEILYLDKNSLSKGATQIVNWMTLYAMSTYRVDINNDLYVENTIGLVDGHNELSDIYSEIIVMYDEHCAIKNKGEYSFEAPKIYINK